MKPTLVPQYNLFQPGSRGIPIHTDYGRPVDVVSLLQLSEQYEPRLWRGTHLLSRRTGKIERLQIHFPTM